MTLPGNYSWKSQVMICWKIGYTRNVQSWATYSSQRDGNHYRDMKCNWSSLRVHVRYMNSDVHEFFRASETSLKVTASYYISVWSVQTVRHWCRSVHRTLRHQCQTVLLPKSPECLGSKVYICQPPHGHRVYSCGPSTLHHITWRKRKQASKASVWQNIIFLIHKILYHNRGDYWSGQKYIANWILIRQPEQ